jgi:uncharacterized protein (DUF1800 family)
MSLNYKFSTMNRFLLLYLGLIPFCLSAQNTFPYAKMGYSDKEAAVHLLNRFTFGFNLDEINQVLDIGHEKWFENQLKGNNDDHVLNAKLKPYFALSLSSEEITKSFLLPVEARNVATNQGINIATEEKDMVQDDKDKIAAYLKENNLYLVRELERQTVNQKVISAIYSKNQLHEVLTDFWFNHFNVFMGKNISKKHILSYERDMIRPNVTGSFEKLLIATAQSPAMLTYLDNFNSTSESNRRMAKGLNENYAREVMELHTLGVDGGYSQSDVTNAAKVFTGWTLHYKLTPFAKLGDQLNQRLKNTKIEIVENNDFLFVGNRHEPGSKTILGKTYQEGYQGGIDFLKDLAIHPSTAQFICKKLAVKFISDTPNEEFVNQMAKVFLQTNGDIPQVLRYLVQSEEFWNKSNQFKKIKSPLEFAVSAVKTTNSEVLFPFALVEKIDKMGQKLYHYQAPTGFPDKGEFWINSGLLLQRLNFAIDLANNNVKGVYLQPMKMLQDKEPESIEDAFHKIFAILLPETENKHSIEKLVSLVSDPNFEKNIKNTVKSTPEKDDETMKESMEDITHMSQSDQNKTLAQVIGIALGSPQFQRR